MVSRSGLRTADGRQLLVWCESYERIDEAIGREKQIKGVRARKIALIQAMNPEWRDLYEALG